MILESGVHKFSDNTRHEFDLFINSTGYEERASRLISKGCVVSKDYVSLLFSQHRVLDFQTNYDCMERVGSKFVEDPLLFCRNDLGKLLIQKHGERGKTLRIGMDVSSMNRTMAAMTLSAVFAYREHVESLHIFYVPAKFSDPKLTFTPIEQIGAVTPELSGFDSEPALPIALVMGLGYEYGTAIGLINELEPQLTICLRAIGQDPRYERAVRKANLDFDFSNYNVTISEYDLLDVASAYRHIENIVYGLMSKYRVVLVPMGPKIFASLLVLVGLKYFGQLAVWRVARSTNPSRSTGDEMYLSASIGIHTSSARHGFDQLRKMIEGEHLEFLSS